MKFILFALLALLPLAPWAEEADCDCTKVFLNETASMEVSHDRIKAVLRIEEEAKEPTSVQNTINSKMQQAVSKAQRYSQIKTTTQNYNVHSFDRWYGDRDDRKSEKFWRGQQTLTLDAADATTLLKLVGEIQALGFAMNGLSYYLSDSKAESYRDQLIQDVLAKLQARAKLVGKQLGMTNLEFAEIRFDTPSTPMPQPLMRTMAMAMDKAESMAQPVAMAGDTTVTVSVYTTVELR